jgi:hypothetical protein
MCVSFLNWVKENGIGDTINIAGKNFAVFDKLFLEQLPAWREDISYLCERRYLDPSILYVDWKTDKKLPSLDECLKRAGVNTNVTHDALQDAIDTLLCFRAAYNK